MDVRFVSGEPDVSELQIDCKSTVFFRAQIAEFELAILLTR